MDDVRFDDLTKTLIEKADSRRGLFQIVFAGLGVAAAGAVDAVHVDAKRGKNKKGQKGKKRNRGLCRPGAKFCNGACIPNNFWGCAREGAYGPEECDDNACYVEQYVCANGRCVPGCWEDHVACGGRCLESFCRLPHLETVCSHARGQTVCENDEHRCKPFNPNPGCAGCPPNIPCCPEERPNHCTEESGCGVCCLPPCPTGKTFDPETCNCVA